MKRIVVFSIVLALFIALGFFIFIFTRGGGIKQPKEEPSQEEILQKELKASSSETMKKAKITLITIYDNYQANPQLKTGWGFSCLVRHSFSEGGVIKEKSILFDTGADNETLLSNMGKIEVDSSEIDFVFISHLHEDHTGGLSGILEIKPDLQVYKPESFSDSAQIINNVWTTGPMGTGIKEQSLIINSGQGLVIITGCAHPGVVNIIKKAKGMFPNENIYFRALNNY